MVRYMIKKKFDRKLANFIVIFFVLLGNAILLQTEENSINVMENQNNKDKYSGMNVQNDKISSEELVARDGMEVEPNQKISKEIPIKDPYFVPDTKLAIETGTQSIHGSEIVADSFGNLYILYGHDFCNFEVYMSSDKGNTWHSYGSLQESVEIGSASMAVDISQSKQTWWYNAEGNGFEEIYVNELYVAYQHEYASDDHDVKLWQVNPSRIMDVDADGEDELSPCLSIYNGLMVISYIYQRDSQNSRIKVAKSIDHGESFSSWKEIGAAYFAEKKDVISVIDKKGVVYIAYKATNIFMTEERVKISWDSVSSDSTSFKHTEALSSLGRIGDISLAVTQHSTAVTRITVGYTSSNWNENSFYHQVYSDDDGETWSDPLIIAHEGRDEGVGPIIGSIYNPQIVVDGLNSQLDVLGNFYYIFEANSHIQCLHMPYFKLEDTDYPRDIANTGVISTTLMDFSTATTHKVNDEWVPAFCYLDYNGICYASVIPPAPVPPEPPTLEFPAEDSIFNHGSLTFEWSGQNLGENAHYRLQVIQINDPSNPLIDTEVYETNTYTPSSPLAILEDDFGTLYNWRVQEKNQYGWSDWSNYFRFWIDTTPPCRPTLNFPSDIILNYNTNIRFNWTTWLHEKYFQLNIKDGDGTTLLTRIFEYGSGGYLSDGYLISPAIIFPDDIIYWKVRGVDSAGNIGEWSSTASFRVDTGKNYSPLLYSPYGTIWENSPTLKWQPIDNASSYRVEICDDPVLEHLVDWELYQHASQFTTTNLLDNTTYYWRVRANYPDITHGNWSTVFSFTINQSAKFALTPNPIYPYQGAVIDPTTMLVGGFIVLNCSSVPGATSYEYIVDTVYPFSRFPYLNEIKSTTSWFFTPLPSFIYLGNGYYEAKTFYWSVRARNETTIFGEWSPVITFTIDDTPPDPPNIITPNYQDIYHSSYISFNWTHGYLKETEIDYYQFQVATDLNFTSILYSEITVKNNTNYLVPGGSIYCSRVRVKEYGGIFSNWSSVVEFSVDLTILPPSIKSPLNNTQLHESGFYLEWNDINRSKPSYQIQISSFFDFSALNINTTTSDLTTYVSVPDGSYYVRIRAKAGTLPYGYWSEIWRFSKNSTTSTTIQYPLEGITLGSPSVKIEWDPLYGALSYEIELAVTPDFGSVFVSPTTSSNQLILRNVSDNTYYTRIRARYSKIDYSPWSSTRTFTVHISDSPLQIHPSDEGLTNDTRPYFEWQPIKGATNYQLVVSNDPNFVKNFLNTTVTTYNFKFRNNLSDGTYYWKIKCNHSIGIYGEWSPTWSFALFGVFSEIPELQKPIFYANISDLTPTLEWNISTQHKYIQFHLQLSNSFEFKDCVINTTVSLQSYTIRTTLDTGIYYWRVRATDGIKSWSFWSNISFFNLTNAGVFSGTPMVLYPSNSTTFQDISSLNITWTPLKGATIYQLEISTFNNFAKKVVTTETLETFYFFTCKYDSYYIRVRARDRYHEYGVWSDVCMFMVVKQTISSSISSVIYSSSTTESSTPKASSIPLMFVLLSLLLVTFKRKNGGLK